MTAVAAPPPRRRPPARRRRGVGRLVWVFLLIPAAVEVGMVFWPAMNSFYLSLTKWNGLGAAQPVGLDNFRDLFSDDIFRGALKNNVIWAIGFGGLSVLGGLALAVALNRPRRGVGLYRSAIYLPMVFSLAVTGLFWRVHYQPDGTINTLLGAIGLASWNGSGSPTRTPRSTRCWSPRSGARSAT